MVNWRRNSLLGEFPSHHLPPGKWPGTKRQGIWSCQPAATGKLGLHWGCRHLAAWVVHAQHALSWGMEPAEKYQAGLRMPAVVALRTWVIGCQAKEQPWPGFTCLSKARKKKTEVDEEKKSGLRCFQRGTMRALSQEKHVSAWWRCLFRTKVGCLQPEPQWEMGDTSACRNGPWLPWGCCRQGRGCSAHLLVPLNFKDHCKYQSTEVMWTQITLACRVTLSAVSY